MEQKPTKWNFKKYYSKVERFQMAGFEFAFKKRCYL